MTQVPPSRYRVVERGRRLEVIDTWAGHGRPVSVTPHPVPHPRRNAPPAQALFKAPAQKRSSIPLTAKGRQARQRQQTDQLFKSLGVSAMPRGTHVFVTKGWYDAKGPRPIALGPEGQARLKGLRFIFAVAVGIGVFMALFFWPLFLFATVFAVIRAGKIRHGIAAWLDKINQPIETSADSSDG